MFVAAVGEKWRRRRRNGPAGAVLLPDARAVSAISTKIPRYDFASQRISTDDLHPARNFSALAVDGNLNAQKVLVGHPHALQFGL